MKTKILIPLFALCTALWAAATTEIPDPVREYAKKHIDGHALMTDETPVVLKKLEMDAEPERMKASTVYRLFYRGYRISCQINVQEKKGKLSHDLLRCWNHFGDDSNPMP